VWHPKQDNDSAELEKSGQEWIIVNALVQSLVVTGAFQERQREREREREVFLRGIAVCYLVGQEIPYSNKISKFIAVLAKSFPLDHIRYFCNIKNAKFAIK